MDIHALIGTEGREHAGRKAASGDFLMIFECVSRIVGGTYDLNARSGDKTACRISLALKKSRSLVEDLVGDNMR